MKLAFFCNYLNHHQVCIADSLFSLLKKDFVFVATLPRNKKELKGGVDYSNRPYCLLACESEEGHLQALEFARIAEVCVFGACSQEYATERAKQKNCGIAFELGERWLKRGWINVLSPVLRRWWVNYMRFYRTVPYYKLCSSAFTAHDDEKIGCYKGRHFKWGYFTEVATNLETLGTHNVSETVSIMWCSRFIDWKHPELALDCVKRLKEDGYNIVLDMYGDGPLLKDSEAWVKNHALSDVVKFHGNVPNTQIHLAMRNSSIFLFTSDRQEGWGVVGNEALAAGCCLVGSDEIGAVPFLVKDRTNGIIFKSKCPLDLYKKVKWILDNPDERRSLSRRGREDMLNIWNASNAAKCLLQLIDDLQNNRETSLKEGPCSIA